MSQILSAFFDFLNQDMPEPIAFSNLSESWFYYLSLVLVIVGSIFLALKFKKQDQKGIQRTILIISILLIAFEVYKQVIFAYSNNWHIRWYAFPFQFCSTAMYATLFVGLTKSEKLYDIGISFLATFSLFAGAAVMFYPGDVFVTTIGINIQTMFYHGSMVAMGIGLIFSGKVKASTDTLFKGLMPMTVFWMIAILLNGVVNQFFPNIGTFNMFLINPRYNSSIPILNMIQPYVAAPIFQLAYLLGITFASFVTFNLFQGMKSFSKIFVHNPALASKKI